MRYVKYIYLLIFLPFLWRLPLHNETNWVDSPNFLAQEAHSATLLSNVSFLKSCFLNNSGRSKLVYPSDTKLQVIEFSYSYNKTN